MPLETSDTKSMQIGSIWKSQSCPLFLIFSKEDSNMSWRDYACLHQDSEQRTLFEILFTQACQEFVIH